MSSSYIIDQDDASFVLMMNQKQEFSGVMV